MELKREGFTFAGTTICYAFMQAVGMVNDHTVSISFLHSFCNTGEIHDGFLRGLREVLRGAASFDSATFNPAVLAAERIWRSGLIT